MTIRGAIWARVSTEEQESGNQLAALRAEAARHGLEVVAEYVLDGLSAWTGAHREQLRRALDDARRAIRGAADRARRAVGDALSADHGDGPGMAQEADQL